MTPAELADPNGPLTLDFASACRLLGCGLTAGRAALARGTFPARVIRVGRTIRIPRADLARLLLTPDKAEAEAVGPGPVTTSRAAGSPARLLAVADPLEADSVNFTPAPAA